jgi:hypothetical protein
MKSKKKTVKKNTVEYHLGQAVKLMGGNVVALVAGLHDGVVLYRGGTKKARLENLAVMPEVDAHRIDEGFTAYQANGCGRMELSLTWHPTTKQ